MTIPAPFSPFISGYTFFESPRWHDGQLWLSDFYTQQIVRVTLQGEVTPVAEVPEQPSGMGWLPDGRLLVVSMRDRRILRQEADGKLVTQAHSAGRAFADVGEFEDEIARTSRALPLDGGGLGGGVCAAVSG